MLSTNVHCPDCDLYMDMASSAENRDVVSGLFTFKQLYPDCKMGLSDQGYQLTNRQREDPATMARKRRSIRMGFCCHANEDLYLHAWRSNLIRS